MDKYAPTYNIVLRFLNYGYDYYHMYMLITKDKNNYFFNFVKNSNELHKFLNFNKNGVFTSDGKRLLHLYNINNDLSTEMSKYWYWHKGIPLCNEFIMKKSKKSSKKYSNNKHKYFKKTYQ